jgi:hypothetical protein
MEQGLSIVAGLVVSILIVVILAWRPIRSAMRQAQLARARKDFHRQREWLEAKFLELASASGKPRGLRWTDCDFDDDARDRRTGELSAFVAVTIAFEAIEGGDMEGVEAVGNLRAATAVFRCSKNRWYTDGRAVFNLNPTEAIAHFRDDLEIVGCEVAQRS